VATLVVKTDSIGHVSVQAAGTSTFTPATNGESLHVGDTVQTDGVGLAEIDYGSDSYTRLDVNTTFTITKLTDSQGNRQVNGTLQTGETWNRTVALTQSESFQQQGAGTTAAVAGTAFVVDCTSPTQCTFTGVIDNVTLTGSNGQTRTLNPLNQCVATSGAVCAANSELTPEQVALIQWIRANVFLDFIERGLGNGIFDPFGGTVTITNGVVQSFTPSTPGQGFTPDQSPPAPPAPTAPTIGSSPILTGGAYQGPGQDPLGGCTSSQPRDPPNQTATEINVGDDCSVDFAINAADATGPFYIHFTSIQSNIGVTGLGQLLVTNDPVVAPGSPVNTIDHYASGDVFTFFANDLGAPADVGDASFQFEAVDTASGLAAAAGPIAVHVLSDCDDGTGTGAGCLASGSTGTASSAVITPVATGATVTTPPTTTTPTTATTSTTAPSVPTTP
jgi:hypothetical protein